MTHMYEYVYNVMIVYYIFMRVATIVVNILFIYILYGLQSAVTINQQQKPYSLSQQ